MDVDKIPTHTDFKSICNWLFVKTRLNPTEISNILTPQNIALMEQAFTHSSYADDTSSEHDMELWEWYGDSFINLCAIHYIRKYAPDIVNITWLSKAKNAFQGKKHLSKIGTAMGFEKFIKCGREIILYKQQVPNWRETEKWLSVVEDCIEATIGVMWHIILTHFAAKTQMADGITYRAMSTLVEYMYIIGNGADQKQILDKALLEFDAKSLLNSYVISKQNELKRKYPNYPKLSLSSKLYLRQFDNTRDEQGAIINKIEPRIPDLSNPGRIGSTFVKTFDVITRTILVDAENAAAQVILDYFLKTGEYNYLNHIPKYNERKKGKPFETVEERAAGAYKTNF